MFNIAAGVAELVDARDVTCLGLYGCAGSSPASGTIKINIFNLL